MPCGNVLRIPLHNLKKPANRIILITLKSIETLTTNSF